MEILHLPPALWGVWGHGHHAGRTFKQPWRGHVVRTCFLSSRSARAPSWKWTPPPAEPSDQTAAADVPSAPPRDRDRVAPDFQFLLWLPSSAVTPETATASRCCQPAVAFRTCVTGQAVTGAALPPQRASKVPTVLPD